MKKKVIALVIDTDLTNEEIETGHVQVSVFESADSDQEGQGFIARNVRVLDSD